jgi:penicillin G amidase
VDDRLVPHVFADDEYALYFIQGYITAKYRLWQMDIQTRAAAGRLSEIFGENFIPYDLEQRRKGMIYAAEMALTEMQKDKVLLACVNAYTQGVNAFIGEPGEMSYAASPIEFKLLDYEPEAWTPLKTTLMLKYMASTLTGFDDDVETTNLKKLLNESDFDALFPDYTDGIDPIIPTEKVYDFKPDSLSAGAALSEHHYFKKVVDIFESQHQKNQVGSNNWALSGSKTKNGNPILCNDPHLQLNLPSLWFEIQLNAPGINCYGASLPGSPAIIIGFNDKIAWGVTNAQVDVRDWYTIEFQDEKKQAYKYGTEWLSTNTRIETVIVKGKEPVIDTVIYTHYGPIVYDEIINSDEKSLPETTNRVGMAMRWMAHESSEELKTFYLLNRAGNYDDYRTAISFFSCPAQNFIFADNNGDVAITQQGRFPIKYKGQGKSILNGADPKDDYKTYIPVEQNPTIKNPSRGFVASANQHPTDSTYPYYYTSYDFEYYRNRVINTTLTQLNAATIGDMQALQQNNFNLTAKEGLEVMLPLINNPCDKKNSACDIYKSLQEWDYLNDAMSITPTYFQIWWDTLYNLIWDEMVSDEIAYTTPNNYFTIKAMRDFATDHILFDVIETTNKKETINDIVQMSFDIMTKTVDSLSNAGENQLAWFNHKSTNIMHISQIQAFSKLKIQNGGYKNIVNATSETHGPSWRMIVELSTPVNAFGIYPGGQSGNPGSKYFNNFVDDWAAGKYYTLSLFKDAEAAKKKSLFAINFKKI